MARVIQPIQVKSMHADFQVVLHFPPSFLLTRLTLQYNGVLLLMMEDVKFTITVLKETLMEMEIALLKSIQQESM